jgi:hypothetical protein
MSLRSLPLDDVSLMILRWVADGCPDGALGRRAATKIRAQALANRGLIAISRGKAGWRATLTENGIFYIRHGHYQFRESYDGVPAEWETPARKSRHAVFPPLKPPSSALKQETVSRGTVEGPKADIYHPDAEDGISGNWASLRGRDRSMNEANSFDEALPATWLDAFPWLRGAAGAHGTPWWDDVIDDTEDEERPGYLARISQLAMERLTAWTIGQIFPGLSPDVDYFRLDLPMRAIHAMKRRGYSSSADLSNETLDSIMDWHQVGVGTVDAILQALANASTSLATPTVIAVGPGSPVGLSFGVDARLPDWISLLVEDLTQIANWYATVGRPGQSLLGSVFPPGTPDGVVKARSRLEGLSADSILTQPELELDVAALIGEALNLIDPRAAQILSARLFADEPTTLDELGRRHDLTRERIRQIEGKARGSMLSLISDEGPLAAVTESVRSLVGTIRPLDDLLSVFPALGKTVNSAGQPVWRVLDRLDDAYQIEDGWCVAPTVTAALAMTQAQLQEGANQYGVARIEDLALVETSRPEHLSELTAAWLSHCGYIVDGNHVLTSTHSVGDYGAAILSIAGSPLSAEEIVDRFAVERTVGSLRNAMSVDERFERVDRDKWALREWGLDAYAGIRSVIREQVAKGGGRVKVDDLIEYVTGHYTVTSSSVTAYASAPPFETRQGVVRLASDDRMIRKTPEGTRRLFRRSDAWAYRVRITTEHLRGSGSVAPVAIAAILDLQYGETRQLDSQLGPQTIAWTSTQPGFGTIRRFLLDQDIAADTDGFLVIHDDGTFSFERARRLTNDPLMDALTLIGAPLTTDVDEARVSFGRAIGLPRSAPVTSMIGGYRERGDGDVADLLTIVRDHLETGDKPERARHSAEVNEILGLL